MRSQEKTKSVSASSLEPVTVPESNHTGRRRFGICLYCCFCFRQTHSHRPLEPADGFLPLSGADRAALLLRGSAYGAVSHYDYCIKRQGSCPIVSFYLWTIAPKQLKTSRSNALELTRQPIAPRSGTNRPIDRPYSPPPSRPPIEVPGWSQGIVTGDGYGDV